MTYHILVNSYMQFYMYILNLAIVLIDCKPLLVGSSEVFLSNLQPGQLQRWCTGSRPSMCKGAHMDSVHTSSLMKSYEEQK